ncbi:MAG: hypothetical protein ACRDPY_49905 [Streptosporangiaceae bacterium]
MPEQPVTVYISIGNRDDGLTQRRWAEFAWAMHSELEALGRLLGEWASCPVAPWQNACWAIEFGSPERAALARAMVANIARAYQQRAVAWAVAPETEML